MTEDDDTHPQIKIIHPIASSSIIDPHFYYYINFFCFLFDSFLSMQ